MSELDHFYFGQLVQGGSAQGDPLVLAKSQGITDQHIELALENAAVPASANSGTFTWGVVRIGRNQPQVLAHVAIGAHGQLTRHIILLNTEQMRALAGNLSKLYTLISPEIPVYTTYGNPLKRLQFADAKAPTAAEQVDTLLNLITASQNKTRNIEPLLAAVVSGVRLIIINAPETLEARLSFVEGLLTLLPSSTRHGITFVLHDTNKSALRAQISFYNAPPVDTNVTVYDWATGQTSGQNLQTDYSRFIVGQLRLDPSLVIGETEKLTRTAGWRFQNGDSLDRALDYASYRAKIDQSVATGLPVEIAQVSKVLMHDPTLAEEERTNYARHLMKLSLAIGDMSNVSPVATIMQRDKKLAREMYNQLSQAAQNGKGRLVFDTLTNWMHDPLSPQGPQWTKLMRVAAISELNRLVADRDFDNLINYLDQIHDLNTVVGPIVPRLVKDALLMVDKDARLAQRVLLLAIRYISIDRLRKLLLLRQFNTAQPKAVQELIMVFFRDKISATPQVILEAVDAFEPMLRETALLTFVKLAHMTRRYHHLTKQVLEQTVTIMTTSKLIDDDLSLIAEISQAISDARLPLLKKPMPRLLLQLQLLGQRYDLLGQSLIVQSRDYYKAEGQARYVLSLHEMFSTLDLTPQRARDALQAMAANGIRNIPLLASMAGALASTQAAPEMKSVAQRLLTQVQAHPQATDVLPPQSFMTLMHFLSRYPDMNIELKLSLHMAAQCCAAQEDRSSIGAIKQAYQLLDSQDHTRPLAIEILRQYVRVSAEKPARYLIRQYGEEISTDVREKLQTSYEFSNLLGRMDLMSYAALLGRTVELLQTSAETFATPHAIPELIHFRRMAESFRDGTNVGDLYDLSRELRRLSQTIVILGAQHQQRSKNTERYIQQIVDGSQEPQSIVDVFRAAGATLTGSMLYPLRLTDGGNEQPFGIESAVERIAVVTNASTLLHQATTARPSNRQMWTQAMIADELRSQMLIYTDTEERNILRQMGRNWQRLADLILHINHESDTKIIEANNRRGLRLDKHEALPADALQLYRFMYGFFAP